MGTTTLTDVAGICDFAQSEGAGALNFLDGKNAVFASCRNALDA